MIENRDLTIDDYLSMLRRRIKLILIPTLLAPLVGFLISLFVPAKYTSTSLVLVEAQQVPTGVVQPVVTEDLVFMLESMGFATGIDLDKLIEARLLLHEGLPEEPMHGQVPKAGIPRTFRVAA